MTCFISSFEESYICHDNRVTFVGEKTQTHRTNSMLVVACLEREYLNAFGIEKSEVYGDVNRNLAKAFQKKM